MMLFQALVKLRKVDLDELGESGKIICDALKMIDENQYSDAKVQPFESLNQEGGEGGGLRGQDTKIKGNIN